MISPSRCGRGFRRRAGWAGAVLAAAPPVALQCRRRRHAAAAAEWKLSGRGRPAHRLVVRAASPKAAAPAIHSGFLSFPQEQIFFGTATAAYQVEGAAAEAGRKPSIWDDFSHTPDKTEDGASGDVACDHYHRFREDVEIMSHMGLEAYRFSISWSRLIPDGEGAVNVTAVKFYSDLIDALLAKGITPWVTLYHWDLPSALEHEFGGWLGPKSRVTAAFGEYARTCFDLFGGRVKNWITLNEPWCSAVLGYNTGDHAPGRTEAPETEPYLAGHNMLLAHAEAVSIYRAEFADKQGGQIGIVVNADWREPRNKDCERHIAAARRAMEFSLGWFAHPVFFGHYPECMRQACGERLPEFTPEEKASLMNSSDFFGINSYSANFAAPLTGKAGGEGYWKDIGVAWWHSDPWWEKTDMGWNVVPWGFRELLLYIHRTYRPPAGIVVTENGCAWESEESVKLDERRGTLRPRKAAKTRCRAEAKLRKKLEGDLRETFDDPQRVKFLQMHLCAVHAARAKGADIRGYFAWSFMDNFEWAYGYTKRFGIVRVDYATQRRTIKSSGRFMSKLISERGFEAPGVDEQFEGVVF